MDRREIIFSLKVLFLFVFLCAVLLASCPLSYAATEADYTKLLLHSDGIDGSTGFADETGKSITAFGNAQIDTAQSKFGSGSALFDGNGDYLSIPDSDDWNFGSGDFTIDFWVRFNDVAAAQCIFARGDDANNKIQWYFGGGSDSSLRFRVLSAGSIIIDESQSWDPSVNTWYHLAIVRNGDNFMTFVDGTLLGSGSTDTSGIPNFTGVFAIGSRNLQSDLHFNGYLDELRISKGIARWTANFTPPTKTYSIATSNIPHLINYQGRLTDSAGAPLNGSYNLTFRIYDAETAGNLLWEEIQSGVVIQKGIFSVLLGSVTNLDLPFDMQYYLEVKVGSEVLSPRQSITSAGYAIRAEEAEKANQAQNANMVGNIGISTTPTANKILPLDSNAKLPLSALKVYDSGWFAVTTGSSYIKTHNLGTTKVIATLWFSTSSDGTNAVEVSRNQEQNTAGYSYSQGADISALTSTSCTIRTGNYAVNFDFATYSYANYTSGYYRLILLALE